MAKGSKKKTHEKFVEEVKHLTGNEYEILGKYASSTTKILIKHIECGREYEITPSHFLSGRRCRNCVNKKSHDEFVAEVLTVMGEDYSIISKYKGALSKVWIKHISCGDTYQANATNITRGHGCKKCGRKTTAEKLTKNTETFKREVFELFGCEYDVLSEYEGSHTYLTIKHNTCGTSYKVTPTGVLAGSGCSYCAGNRQRDTTMFKKLVLDRVGLDYLVVGEYISSHVLIELKHVECSHEYVVTPASFLNGRRCPKCNGTHRKTTKEFQEEVKSLTNGNYEILDEYINSRHKLHVKHNECGNVFEVTPHDFLSGRRCINCNSSLGEARVSEILSALNVNFSIQHRFTDCKDKRPLPFDFAINRESEIVCLIEYDGGQHFRPVEIFGGEEGFQDRQRKDAIKSQYCADNGIPLIRIPYWDYDNIDAILTEKLLPLLYNADKHNAS